MAKRQSASNAVVNAVEQVAALYGVRSYRMNSRTFEVKGAGGRMRPMFMGQWRDELGIVHQKGMADLLLTPRIKINRTCFPQVIPMNTPAGSVPKPVEVCVVLWVECKSGTGELTKDQRDFRDDVVKAGAFYIEAHDDAEEVLQWLEKNEVS